MADFNRCQGVGHGSEKQELKTWKLCPAHTSLNMRRRWTRENFEPKWQEWVWKLENVGQDFTNCNPSLSLPSRNNSRQYELKKWSSHLMENLSNSRVCTWNCRVRTYDFNGIHTLDLCHACAALLRTEPWTYTVESRSIRSAHEFPWKETFSVQRWVSSKQTVLFV